MYRYVYFVWKIYFAHLIRPTCAISRKNTEPKCCIFRAVIKDNSCNLLWRITSLHITRYVPHLCRPPLPMLLLYLINHSSLYLSLWARSKNPLSYNGNPTSSTIGFPQHPSCSPFFAEAAELKSINNVIKGSYYPFPLNFLI